jgi:hypothetical protein
MYLDYVETQFEKYRIVQEQLFQGDFDLFLETEEEANKNESHRD